MVEFRDPADIVRYAIDRETEAERFYLDLSVSAAHPWMKAVFEDFAREEAGHRAKLEAVLEGRMTLPETGTVQDLRIGDDLVEPDPGDTDYAGALVLAMKREKESFRLYQALAEAAADDDARRLFLGLAMEEARHKLRIEIEYDDLVLTEN